ncbi:bifunctional 5,10-methylene-tetrahydrofolate dehydrogenase/5,10-methylene-tetrahydrofolate cyclohydrolase [Halorarum halophilum]|uniref:Bifunctional protein FolD n=1 Tax=Halorarum halophilum TaxID=2743090 RepID=A0A7D5K0B4_9EURY|nr:tetrahydrofolate dehydrogenase/cyclohydrolase catalytic domain-containing protein [Halobaculum halophilum]QLG26681.1 bifunctional 5,10-methylene-tetrahydrofolate dehydrogenase/5,10-methylene-tetrahydrofolate cyclohydrolase [Halobaculum halophilum]
MTDVIDGNAVAADIREGVTECVDVLEDSGVRPGLATVLMSDDPASETYVSMKQRDCEEVGIEGIHVDVDNDAPAQELYDTIESLNDDDAVHGVLVQKPFVDQVDERRVLRTIDPVKDVDAFHPENVGRLVAGDPLFKPCTPHGIQRLLAAADVDPEGKEAVVVGRSDIVGKPMANMLFGRDEGGNATTTVCHSRTADLAEHTRRADIVVAAAGVPEFITGDMLSEGAVVVDVGINRVERNGESTLVGDVAFESAKEKASAITPVPGGVGPMTRAMLLYNTVKAAGLEADVDVPLP